MNNYNIIPLQGSSQYDLKGVRFHGKQFVFWAKKNTSSFNQAIVIFNQAYANVELKSGEAVLSLESLKDYHDIYEAITIFKKATNTEKLSIKFLIDNEQQKKLAEAISYDLNADYQIVNAITGQTEKNSQDLQRNNQINSTNQSEKLSTTASSVNTSASQLNIEELKTKKLQEIMKDPRLMSQLTAMSKEQREKWLTDAVLKNQPNNDPKIVSNNPDNPLNQTPIIPTEPTSTQNSKMEIPQTQTSNVNISSTSKEQDNNSPMVSSTIIASAQQTNNTYQTPVFRGNQTFPSTHINKDQTLETKEESKSVFYINNNEIYDHLNNFIGKIGLEGYVVNENNELIQNGRVLGVVGDASANKKYNESDKIKPMVKTLKKPERTYETTKSSAFISLPVIIFIFSAILLITSFVLLFVLD